MVTTGIQDARDKLRTYVDAALAERQHTVIERHGKPVAVLVPLAWYISKGGDPRQPLEQLADAEHDDAWYENERRVRAERERRTARESSGD